MDLDDTAEDHGRLIALPIQGTTFETKFVEDLDTQAFLLARWLDTG